MGNSFTSTGKYRNELIYKAGYFIGHQKMSAIMWITGRSTRLLAALLLFTFGFALQGCRESEQNRILSYEKGTYLGKPDQKLSAAQKEQLRQRAKTVQQY